MASEIEQLSGMSKKRKEEPELRLLQIMEVHPKYFSAVVCGGKQRRLRSAKITKCGICCARPDTEGRWYDVQDRWSLLSKAAAILGSTTGQSER